MQDPKDPLDDDRDQENPQEFSEDHDFENHDWDSDPDWGPQRRDQKGSK